MEGSSRVVLLLLSSARLDDRDRRLIAASVAELSDFVVEASLPSSSVVVDLTIFAFDTSPVSVTTAAA